MLALEPSEQSDWVVQIDRLTRKFGSKTALDSLSLSVPRGVVFGLVGLNGAGKTTLIKHMMGLYRALPGQVTVLGNDPGRHPERALQSVGYMTEEDSLPGWMRVGQLIRFYEPFYPTWDDAYAVELLRTFSLNANDRIKHLSKGQRARVGLLVALAHRPQLLILDEPSSGLDPLVRTDILEAIIRTITDLGSTVIFSSHLLDEVQRMSDFVAVIHQGKVIESGPTDVLSNRYHRVGFEFQEARNVAPEIAGTSSWSGHDRFWSAVVDTQKCDLQHISHSHPITIESDSTLSLHDWFIDRVTKTDLKEVHA